MDPVSQGLMKAYMMCRKSGSTVWLERDLEKEILNDQRKRARGSHREEIDVRMREKIKQLKQSIKESNGTTKDVDDLNNILKLLSAASS